MTFVIKEMAAIERAQGVLETAGSTAEEELKGLLDQIDGLGAPWGGDAPGQAFWQAYQGAAETVARNASQVGAQVKVLAQNTSTTIASYRATESENAQVAATAGPSASAGAPTPAGTSDSTAPSTADPIVHTPTDGPVDTTMKV